MEADNKCKFCEKSFSTKTNLITHQKTAKYCLKKQSDNINSLFKCTFCDKTYTSKRSLIHHGDKCSLKKELDIKTEILSLREKCVLLEKELEIKNQEIKFLFDILKKQYSNRKPKKIDDVLISCDLTSSDIEDIVNTHFTPNYFGAGLIGVAEFCYEHIISKRKGKLSIVCTDLSRKIFKFVDKNGKIETDIHATRFIDSINKAIQTKADDMYENRQTQLLSIYNDNTFLNDKRMEISDLSFSGRNSKFLTKLAILLAI
jgi:hypothetical protein